MKISSFINCFISLAVFVFWAFFYPNHVLFTEQFSFFLYTSEFWKEYALQPSGWSAYCGNFLAQFYFSRWTGALIQTLLVAALLFTSNRILLKMKIKAASLLMSILPAMLLLALQVNDRFTPGNALALICPFALTLLYMNMSNEWFRRLVFTLMIVPVYLFCGAVATCSLYAVCMLYELWNAKDQWKYITPVWLMAAIFLPKCWQSVYLTSDSALFAILTITPSDELKYVPWLLLAFIPFCILAVRIFRGQRWTTVATGKTFFVIALLLLAGCAYYLFPKTFSRLQEQKFGMCIAANQNKWDEILKIAKQVKTPDMYTVYFTNLALAMKGELPQKMFQYPQTDITGLTLPRMTENFTLLYGSEFYYRIGILNEAIHWIFDAHIERAGGMDYLTLTRLAAWNKENGYEKVAAKYFDVLGKTMRYRSWAKHQQTTIVPKKTKNAYPQTEFYVGGREPMVDLAYHYENNPENSMVIDYLLCSLLLKNELPKFLSVFQASHPYMPEKLPQTYQEAFLLLADMGKIDIRSFPIDQMTVVRFRNFKELAGRRDDAKLKKQFANTWWWYHYRMR